MKLSTKALKQAIQNATTLDDLKRAVAESTVRAHFNDDGTIRGLHYCNPSTKRGAVLQVTIDRGQPDALVTSKIVDGKDFRTVYREMVNSIAGHYGISSESEIGKKMHSSVEAFLARNGLKLIEIRFEQVVRAKDETRSI